jgi:hypothetical protein
MFGLDMGVVEEEVSTLPHFYVTTIITAIKYPMLTKHRNKPPTIMAMIMLS